MGKFKKKKSGNKDKKSSVPDFCQANMSEVANDIIGIKFKKSDTLSGCLKKFYEIMEKHGIKQGTPSFNDNGERVGRKSNNFEWSMSVELFLSQLSSFLKIQDMFNVPKNLSEYE